MIVFFVLFCFLLIFFFLMFLFLYLVINIPLSGLFHDSIFHNLHVCCQHYYFILFSHSWKSQRSLKVKIKNISEDETLLHKSIVLTKFYRNLVWFLCLIVYQHFWWCPWCNGYRCRKWTRQLEFKSWTRMIAFHIALITLGKVWIQLFSFQLWVNSRTDWVLQLGETTSLGEGKLNSNLLNPA